MGTYQIQGTAATPTFTPASGTSFSSPMSVSIADATPSASIYYTTDGSTPTTGSPLYSGPFTIGATTTVHAIATASGYTQGAQGSASYTYTPTESAAATPTFSPGAGTYTSTQSVTIADTTPGATIYYTTNGTTPTTSSAVYSSAIPVSASMTLEAIAVAPGYTQSALATAAYVIQSSGTSTINFAAGFPSATGLQLNGSAAVNSSKFLELTNGGTAQASSAFWTTPVNIQAFTTNFTFQLSSAAADGFTFTIQNAGKTALGGSGGGLGYGPDPGATGTASIAKSVAIKFDLYNNSGEGTDSTGIYTNGATPTVPAVDLTSSGIVLSSGDTISAQLVYNGTTLTLNLTDTVTNDTFSYAFTVNIPSTVGANTAYVGFTAGTGGETAIQNIKNWTFTSGTTQVTAAATPTFTPASGTSFSSPMSVSIADATPSASIYYTTDGSTPTTGSPLYSGPFTIGATTTVHAIATASGYTQGAQGSASYTYTPTESAAATPTFSPGAGTYTSNQSVTIADTTPGATIYYTTNGTAPTTSSAVYSSVIPVNGSTTLEAIAVAPGFTQSALATAAYVIQSSGTSTINFAGGFPSATGLQLNGSTASKLQQIPGTYQWRHGSSFERLLDYTGQHSGLHHQLHLPAFQRCCRRIHLHHPECRQDCARRIRRRARLRTRPRRGGNGQYCQECRHQIRSLQQLRRRHRLHRYLYQRGNSHGPGSRSHTLRDRTIERRHHVRSTCLQRHHVDAQSYRHGYECRLQLCVHGQHPLNRRRKHGLRRLHRRHRRRNRDPEHQDLDLHFGNTIIDRHLHNW